MPGVYYAFQSGDIFQTIPGQDELISIDQLDSLVTPKYIALYTNIQITGTNINQFFQTFDSLIHYIQFGKGIGMVTVTGAMFPACDNSFPGLGELLNLMGQLRNKVVMVSVSAGTSAAFSGLVDSTILDVTADQGTMATFQVNMKVFSDTLSQS